MNSLTSVIKSVVPAITIQGNGVEVRGLRVGFPNGTSAFLPETTQGFDRYQSALDTALRFQRSAYLELDESGTTVRAVRTPINVVVERVKYDREAGISIVVRFSNEQYVLPLGSPRFAQLSRYLSESHDVVETLLTVDDRSVILDARRAEAFDRIYRETALFAIPPATVVPSVGLDEARAMFAMVNATSCDPLAPTDTCTPFLYPDEGCQSRAHAMCNLLLSSGKSVFKIWAFDRGGMRVETPDIPGCHTTWQFHVAAAITVAYPGSGIVPQTWVLDPALFPDVVPLRDWTARLQGASVCTRTTNPEVYSCDIAGLGLSAGSDTGMNIELEECRESLKSRSQRIGKPPYNCINT